MGPPRCSSATVGMRTMLPGASSLLPIHLRAVLRHQIWICPSLHQHPRLKTPHCQLLGTAPSLQRTAASGTDNLEAQQRYSSRVANASALHRGQNPQNREKRGFGVEKLLFPKAPEKGDLSRKIPIFPVEPCREMGIFRLKTPFSGALGNGSF